MLNHGEMSSQSYHKTKLGEDDLLDLNKSGDSEGYVRQQLMKFDQFLCHSESEPESSLSRLISQT